MENKRVRAHNRAKASETKKTKVAANDYFVHIRLLTHIRLWKDGKWQTHAFSEKVANNDEKRIDCTNP